MLFVAIVVGMLCSFDLYAGEGIVYETKAWRDDVKTLRTSPRGETTSTFPLIRLGDGNGMEFSFDCVNGEIGNYDYTVVHCDKDWRKSALSEPEWCEGFATNAIEDAATSMNTTVPYVHYRFSLPNQDCKFKVSGNYAVVVHDAEDVHKIVATYRLYVSEQSATVLGKVNGETRKEMNGRYQQMELEVAMHNVSMVNPMEEMEVSVMQNDRPDTRVVLKPTYMSGNKFVYRDKDDLVWEGGNEYRTIDFSSRFAYNIGVESVRYYDPYYHVTLVPGMLTDGRGKYEMVKDANGRYVTHVQEYGDDDLESDYYLVHFFVSAETPLFDGKMYVIGAWNDNRMDERSRMLYNASAGGYERTVLLKQGGYSFVYAYQPNGSKRATLERTEGSYWQTENEYRVMVYHRPFGACADRLVNVTVLTNQ